MFDPWHPFPYSHVDEFISLYCLEIILEYDFLGGEVSGEAHVFVIGKGCTVVEIIQIKSAKSAIRCGNDAIHEHLDGNDVSTCRRCVASKVKTVTIHSETDAVVLFLEGVDSIYEAPVGNLFVGRDSGFSDEEDGVIF